MEKTMTEKTKCAGRVPGEGQWGAFHMQNCSRNSMPGSTFCKTHDPKMRAAKFAALDAGWKADRNKQDELRNLFPSPMKVWVTAPSAKCKDFKVEFSLSEEEVRRLALQVSS